MLRAAVWSLHVLVSFVAVFSLFTNRFDLWLDLRMLGGAWGAVVKIFWVGATLLVPWCAGPRLGKGWVNGGLSGEWAKRLLWPTYFVIACLIANTVYYYQLLASGVWEADFPVPITLVAAVVLGAWALLTREWIRRGAGAGERSGVGWPAKVLGIAYAVLGIVAVGGFFLLHVYGRPMAGEPVDVAVVLGNRVMPDGTASVLLRDRTLAAISLYRRGLVRHLFLSGAVYPGKRPGDALRNEPAAMRRVCLEHGVPAWAITLDPYGVNTRATAHNAREFMQSQGYRSLVVCTDDSHLFRTVLSCRQEGLDPYTAASVKQAWTCAELQPTAREVAGILVYRFDPEYRPAKEAPMVMNAPSVVVRKAAHVLELYDEVDGQRTLVKTYACITGGNAGDKEVEGDRKTPLGRFHVVFKTTDSKYHLSLGLDYPSAEDAERGLKEGLITRAEYDGILEALKSDLSQVENQRKLWYTKLGGEIFIHGNAEGRTGTAGCVALSNVDVEEVFKLLPVGTVVEIVP
jgi:uncharacterized SAM-binding protein YcdF (DUF218 family)/L,D-peptidoglycan transpeptidase YkuD (ErfK/YbiS/YcfS/YnhG family)